MTGSDILLELEAVGKDYDDPRVLAFGGRRRPVRAVADLHLAIRRGETFALVGESGSGKSTTARLVMRLEPPTSGTIRFDGSDLRALRGRARRAFQAATHIVFQDPNLSLSPRMRVGEIVGEPLDIQGVRSDERKRRAAQALEEVGLDPGVAVRYPHEFSGGQRQRIAIARAIAVQPSLIVLDEPVSALDVSIRAQILNLLRDLQRRHGLTYLTIAHDLAVVYQASDRTGVMYRGGLMELGPTESVFRRPLHPYTRSLIQAIPIPDPKRRRARATAPAVADALDPRDDALVEHGCSFRAHCPLARETCADSTPEWREVEPGRWVACHFATSAIEPIVDG